MTVSRGHEDLIWWNAATFGDERPCLVSGFPSHAQIVHHNHGDRRGPVVQHQGASVKRIVYDFSRIALKTARQVQREFLRRDVDRSRSGAEWRNVLSRGRDCDRSETNRADQCSNRDGHVASGPCLAVADEPATLGNR